ncbi:hypothetical protein HGD80_02675 [Paulownia witches'-broom phytoplasma]|uniref:Chromosome segregation ATPase n=1 Tax=Paulownia witches'-broom phytoplasma TaxID=39647 RepID=A0ABX8TMR0_9MOLU|nr:hypothetical protein [Paulownia witches'-broom phytoplasma]QYC30731.1 hypothetical protein HGD80_02675 [Paulownia witches'-broom phytoplasma]
MASNIQDVEQLKAEITKKQQQLEEKEQKLSEQKDLSANEVKQLNEEINNLKNNIEQKQVNYQAHLLIKEEEIKQLQENEKNLKEQLTKKQEETKNLREQHVKTLEEIQRQITNYKKTVSELENETLKLKEQIEKNKENAKQLQQKLLNKQTQINTINQELVNLSNQQTSLQQELSNLTQTYDEWQTTCDLKANQDINEDRIKDETIYYSPVPFAVEITQTEKLDRNNQQIQIGPPRTIKSQPIEINGATFYYIRPCFTSKRIYFTDKNRSDWSNYINQLIVGTRWQFKFNQNVSTTPPPNKLNNYQSVLHQKRKNLNEITQKLSNKQQELNKYQQEINDLINNQQPDDILQQELNNKETHIKTLKGEMQQLEIKEQGFRSEIDILKLENKNLKEKYNNDLNKIKQGLDATKTENKQLEKVNCSKTLDTFYFLKIL